MIDKDTYIKLLLTEYFELKEVLNPDEYGISLSNLQSDTVITWRLKLRILTKQLKVLGWEFVEGETK